MRFWKKTVFSTLSIFVKNLSNVVSFPTLQFEKMMRVATFASVTGCLGYTGFNGADAPGNWNMPAEGGNFGGDVAKSLPEINVQYHYPHVDAATMLAEAQDDISLANRINAAAHELKFDEAVLHSLPTSFLQGSEEGEIYSTMANAGVSAGANGQNGMWEMMLGLAHAARPHSFLQKAEPVEMLPPGIASGAQARVSDETPYTLNLSPPADSAGETNGLMSSLFKIENMREAAIEGSSIAEKQRLLNAEISRVHALVAGSRHKSFLQYAGMVRKADYEIDLHEPAESRGDIQAAANSVLKAESSAMQTVSSADAALKKDLLTAEMGKIRRIVAGAFR